VAAATALISGEAMSGRGLADMSIGDEQARKCLQNG